MKDTTLVVMAAGMGSRFGGLKQMEPVDAKGRVLLDYSVIDAKKAGFNKVCFIIKKEIEEDFKRLVGERIRTQLDIDVSYVMQTTDNLPDGRKKPWGTAHAILCCRDTVTTPFVAINADDYYGANAFKEIHDYLVNAEGMNFSMVSYHLDKTVSENGTVARGVCQIEDGKLKTIRELTKINSKMQYTEDDGATWTQLPEDTLVSMNLWGLTPDIFPELENRYVKFLCRNDLMKAEYLIPIVIGELVEEGKATVKVFTNKDKWYGMTYKEDKEEVVKALADLTEAGIYD